MAVNSRRTSLLSRDTEVSIAAEANPIFGAFDIAFDDHRPIPNLPGSGDAVHHNRIDRVDFRIGHVRRPPVLEKFAMKRRSVNISFAKRSSGLVGHGWVILALRASAIEVGG